MLPKLLKDLRVPSSRTILILDGPSIAEQSVLALGDSVS
jgi:hypothetical protein